MLIGYSKFVVLPMEGSRSSFRNVVAYAAVNSSPRPTCNNCRNYCFPVIPWCQTTGRTRSRDIVQLVNLESWMRTPKLCIVKDITLYSSSPTIMSASRCMRCAFEAARPAKVRETADRHSRTNVYSASTFSRGRTFSRGLTQMLPTIKHQTQPVRKQ